MMKLKNKKISKVVTFLLVFLSFVTFLFVSAPFVHAWAGLGQALRLQQQLIQTKQDELKGSDEGAKKQAAEESKFEDFLRNVKDAGAVAFKQGLGYLLNSIAYESATWIASGGEGQDALFQQLGWQEYSKRVLDNAAGHFIEGLADNWPTIEGPGGVKIGLKNICKPDFRVHLGITLGLQATARPKDPDCSWSQIQSNWENFIQDPNFLNRFAVSLDPKENELGAAFSAYGNFFAYTISNAEQQEKERQEGEGLKPVKNFVDAQIITPTKAVDAKINQFFDIDSKTEEQYTGTPVADAVGTFVNTLASRLLDNVLKKGLALLAGDGPSPKQYDWKRLEGIISETASPATQGTIEARQKFSGLLDSSFAVGDPSSNQIDVSGELFRNGIINIQQKTAIDNRLTLREAIRQNLFVSDGAGATFAYISANKQPTVYEGYSHDAMIIMRSYGVLPVGWEIAANYILNNIQSQTYSLGDMIRSYNNPGSPFYRLVNQDWVLKAPLTYCRLNGPTDELTSEAVEIIEFVDTTEDPGVPYPLEVRNVTRDQNCVDRRTCIFEDRKNNTCSYYGICTQSRPDWDFNSESCPAYFNSCQIFTNREDEDFAYLSDTLNIEGCNPDNIGCQWYCTDYNIQSGVWTCLGAENQVLQKCQNFGACINPNNLALSSNERCALNSDCISGESCQNAGCEVIDSDTGLSCVIGVGEVSCSISACPPGNNVVPNNGFETDPSDLAQKNIGGILQSPFAEGWYTTFDIPDQISRVSGTGHQVFGGTYSLRVYGNGANDIISATSDIFTIASTEIDASDVKYVLSGSIYSNLIYGLGTLRVIDENGRPNVPPNVCETPFNISRGKWEDVRCEFVVPKTVVPGSSYNYRVEINVSWDDENDNGAVDGREKRPVGNIWFDTINVSPSCPLENIVLNLEGTEDFPQSKIYFDRDVKECTSQDSGCSKLISLAENNGSNLIDNGSFELWSGPNNLPPDGWFDGQDGANRTLRVVDDAFFGQTFLRLSNSAPLPAGDRDFTSGRILSMERGKNYVVSFYAKSSTPNTDWEAQIISRAQPELAGTCSVDPTIDCFNNEDCEAFSAGVCVPSNLTCTGDRTISCIANTDCQAVVAGFCRGSFCTLDSSQGCNIDDDCQATGTGFCDSDTQVLTISGVSELPLSESWQRFIFDPIRARFSGVVFELNFANSNAVNNPIDIDGVQVELVSEENQVETQYKDYATYNQTYMKLPPYWLECTGNLETDHSACQQYATKCDVNEVGCTLYSPINGDPEISGIASIFDQCPAECVGYQSMSMSETYFERSEFPVNFVPSTARECNSENAGCNTFTNLDTVASGGEGLESYTYIRQCRKPDSRQCKVFFSWKGDAESGFQLVSHNLLDSNPNDAVPDTISLLREDLGLCRYNGMTQAECTAAEVAAGPVVAGDGIYDWEVAAIQPGCFHRVDAEKNSEENPNCTEYISREEDALGNRTNSYIHFQHTIVCQDECSPLRDVRDEDAVLERQAVCEEKGGFVGTCMNRTVNPPTAPDPCPGALHDSECYTTEAICNFIAGFFPGITFELLQPENQCIFFGAKSLSTECPLAESACREYKGNSSGNVRVIFDDNFEKGTSEQWRAGQLSNESLTLGGHSLLSVQSTDPIQHHIQTQVLYVNEDTDVADVVLPSCSAANYPACDSALGVTNNCYVADTKICPLRNKAGFECTMFEGEDGCGILDGLFVPGRAYMVSFWARSATAFRSVLNIDFVSPTGPAHVVLASQPVFVTQDWQSYNLGPFIFDEDVSPFGMSMRMWSPDNLGDDRPVNFDFITIREVQEFTYLIKDSWTTPISCDTNPLLDTTQFPPPNSPQHMLGCQQYITNLGETINLKSFDSLCRESSVGCETFIDTKNSSSPYSETFNSGSLTGSVGIPEDEVVYYVLDPNKQCLATAAGCQELGIPTIDADNGEVQNYGTRYLLNNPDSYSSILCEEEALGCQEFVSGGEGIVYFKDFPDRRCEYRRVTASDEYGWFKIGSESLLPDCPTTQHRLGNIGPGKSCVGGVVPGALCESDVDCNPAGNTGGKCLWWTGICQQEFATCNTFVDPLSDIEASIIPNSNFEGHIKVCTDGITSCLSDDQCDAAAGETCTATRARFWSYTDNLADAEHRLREGVGASSAMVLLNVNEFISQTLSLEGSTLYTLSAHCKSRPPVTCNADFRVTTNPTLGGSGRSILRNFDNSLNIVDPTTAILHIENDSPEFQEFNARFFVTDSDTRVSVIMEGTGVFDDVEVKKTGIYYYLESGVDKTSCNGIVDSTQGCVLFNNTRLPNLQFDSLHTAQGETPELCGNSGCDSNEIIKVRPERACSEWLDCVTSRTQDFQSIGIEAELCQQLSVCNSINPINGKCNNFPQVGDAMLEFEIASVDKLSNYTGLSKVGYTWSDGFSSIDGYYHYGAMKQRSICVNPSAPVSVEQCLDDVDCDSSIGSGDGNCQAVLDIRDDNFIYQSCRLYPQSSSPRWGAHGPADTGEAPSKSYNPLVDISNPLGNFETRNASYITEASECTYTNGGNVFQGLYGFCIEKNPLNENECLNWLPVDEVTGGWIGLEGWVDQVNLRQSMYYCSEGKILETRKPHAEEECYRTDFWLTPFDPATYGISVDNIPIAEEYGNIINDSNCGFVICPVGYVGRISDGECGNWPQFGLDCKWHCVPDEADFVFQDSDGRKWYDYKPKFDADGAVIKEHRMWCPDCNGKTGQIVLDPDEGDTRIRTTSGELAYPPYWLRVCDEVIRVSDENQANLGWKRRLEALTEFLGANYVVPNLDFKVGSINIPFGSVHRKYQDDPKTWDYLMDQVIAKDYDNPLFPEFSGGNNIGQIYFDTYQDPSAVRSDPTPFQFTRAEAVERIKRLFARSYGIWRRTDNDVGNYVEIIENQPRCVGGPSAGQSCESDPNICRDEGPGASRCIASPGYCKYSTDSGTPGDFSDDKRAVNQNVTCTDSGAGTSAQCANLVFCSHGFCRDSRLPCRTGAPVGDVSACAPGDVCVPPDSGSFGRCQDDPNRICTINDNCESGVCQLSPSIGRCSTGVEGGSPCDAGSRDSCSSVGSECVGVCSEDSAVAGKECGTDGECRVNGLCASFSYWSPPDVQCVDNIRPGYPSDYCGIAPIIPVSTMNIENSSGPLFDIRGDAENVVLSFNVLVDDDQLPLRILEVDWGDKTERTKNAPKLGFKDKRDPDDPFIFTHQYRYDRAISTCAEPEDNNGGSFCLFTISIRVQDNWGWWTKRGPAGSNGFFSFEESSPGDEESVVHETWIYVPTRIRVFQ